LNSTGRGQAVGYWIATVLIALAMLLGGAMELIHQKQTLAGMTSLGYPPYFSTILGTWKVLGAIVLLAPRLPRLKEWAYAGVFFDLTGAAISHAACAQYSHIIAPAILAVICLVSWALRPPGRMLGSICCAPVAV
jgi:hypothetical protein